MHSAHTAKCTRQFPTPPFDDAGLRIVWTSKKELLLFARGRTEIKFTL
jgi:hypothetical protein